MSVARSYAKALYEAAIESKMAAPDLDKIEETLGHFVELFNTSKELRIALFGPATSAREKSALMKDLMNRMMGTVLQAVFTGSKDDAFSKLLKNFVLLLARKERLSLLAEVKEAFGSVRLEAEGGVRGILVSADPVDEVDQKNLANAFSRKLGKKVVFRSFLDPSLLAGVKITINGVTYDGTLRAQLQQLRDRLVFGSSRIH